MKNPINDNIDNMNLTQLFDRIDYGFYLQAESLRTLEIELHKIKTLLSALVTETTKE